jgi:prepilin-type N-terminal cleavage/methylation domain-containing protein
MKGLNRGEKGFTLVELLIVVAILGILAAVVIPNVVGLLGRGGKQAFLTDEQTIQLAAATYFSDVHQGFSAGATADNPATPASFDDNRWGIDPLLGNTTAGHYYPTVIAVVGNHFLSLDTLAANNDPAQKANPRVLGAAGGPATDAEIIASAIWMGLLVNPSNDPACTAGGVGSNGITANDQLNRWAVAVPDPENALYLNEYPKSASFTFNGNPQAGKSGGYAWVVGQNGRTFGAYKAPNASSTMTWYAGFSGAYP